MNQQEFLDYLRHIVPEEDENAIELDSDRIYNRVMEMDATHVANMQDPELQLSVPETPMQRETVPTVPAPDDSLEQTTQRTILPTKLHSIVSIAATAAICIGGGAMMVHFITMEQDSREPKEQVEHNAYESVLFDIEQEDLKVDFHFTVKEQIAAEDRLAAYTEILNTGCYAFSYIHTPEDGETMNIGAEPDAETGKLPLAQCELILSTEENGKIGIFTQNTANATQILALKNGLTAYATISLDGAYESGTVAVDQLSPYNWCGNIASYLQNATSTGEAWISESSGQEYYVENYYTNGSDAVMQCYFIEDELVALIICDTFYGQSEPHYVEILSFSDTANQLILTEPNALKEQMNNTDPSDQEEPSVDVVNANGAVYTPYIHDVSEREGSFDFNFVQTDEAVAQQDGSKTKEWINTMRDGNYQLTMLMKERYSSAAEGNSVMYTYTADETSYAVLEQNFLEENQEWSSTVPLQLTICGANYFTTYFIDQNGQITDDYNEVSYEPLSSLLPCGGESPLMMQMLDTATFVSANVSTSQGIKYLCEIWEYDMQTEFDLEGEHIVTWNVYFNQETGALAAIMVDERQVTVPINDAGYADPSAEPGESHCYWDYEIIDFSETTNSELLLTGLSTMDFQNTEISDVRCSDLSPYTTMAEAPFLCESEVTIGADAGTNGSLLQSYRDIIAGGDFTLGFQQVAVGSDGVTLQMLGTKYYTKTADTQSIFSIAAEDSTDFNMLFSQHADGSTSWLSLDDAGNPLYHTNAPSDYLQESSLPFAMDSIGGYVEKTPIALISDASFLESYACTANGSTYTCEHWELLYDDAIQMDLYAYFTGSEMVYFNISRAYIDEEAPEYSWEEHSYYTLRLCSVPAENALVSPLEKIG